MQYVSTQMHLDIQRRHSELHEKALRNTTEASVNTFISNLQSISLTTASGRSKSAVREEIDRDSNSIRAKRFMQLATFSEGLQVNHCRAASARKIHR